MRHILSLAVILLACAPDLAPAASIPPAKIASVQQAAAELKKMGAPARETGKPPRESEPRIKTLLDTVFDLRVLHAGEPLPFSELGNVNAWNKAIIEAGSLYIFAGTGTADIAQAQNDPAILQQVDRNTVAFAPEMGRYFDAQLGISQALLALINAHLAANPGDRDKPNFKAGLPDIFDGAARTLASSISTLPTTGLTDAWRKARLPAMQRLAPHVAKVVGADDAKTLSDMAQEAAQGSTDPDLAEGLRKLAAVFQR